MGLEICEQVPDLDACVIPVGGGGLIAGTARAIKTLYPHVKIIVSCARVKMLRDTCVRIDITLCCCTRVEKSEIRANQKPS